MNQAIVIASTPTYNQFLANLLRSLHSYQKYQILILSDYTYELGKINYIYNHTDIDEFFLLQDTCEIKNTSLFDILFKQHKGHSVVFGARYASYLMKYTRKTLSKIDIPIPKNKHEAVHHEFYWNDTYRKLEPDTHLLFPNFIDTNVFIDKFDRHVMVLENDYLIKYKSCWNGKMIDGNEKLYSLDS